MNSRATLASALLLGSWCPLTPAALVAQSQAGAASGDVGATIAERVRGAAEAEFAKSPVGALSIALLHDGQAGTLHLGHADGRQGPPPTGTTVYRLGSVTKNFTALMLLQLEAADRCRFSDPVERYLPEFAQIPSPPPSGAKVTLVQLATHTSGLVRDPEPAEPFQLGPVAQWRTSLKGALLGTHYRADPGSTFSYSNIGYACLGAALEQIAGKPYATYMSERILQPLGMTDTVFELQPAQRARLAPGYTISHDGASTDEAEAELAGRGYRLPVGGLFSTVDDMTRWLRFQMGEPAPDVFSAAALAAAQRRVVLSGPGLRSGYGIGVQLRRFGEVVVFGHSGGVPGYQAEMFFDPERHIGIVMLRSAVFGGFDSGAILAAAFAPPR
ncbi:MAG TPA: serine hydrolase domain-containing protein [Planctomycetota bacterium]|nr:serine hydrolase domain-containing protein [Planctomycetota bacterium]